MLFIVTLEAVKAVESGIGALAFEMQISNARRLARKDGFRIIPMFREGSATSTYLSDHRYIDFRNDAEYDSRLTELIHWLLGEIRPPMLGSRSLCLTLSEINIYIQARYRTALVKDTKYIFESVPWLTDTRLRTSLQIHFLETYKDLVTDRMLA